MNKCVTLVQGCGKRAHTASLGKPMPSVGQWFKMAQAGSEVGRIASEVRESIVNRVGESLKAMCLPVSRHLAQVLINQGYKSATVVEGTFYVDDPDWEVSESSLNIDDFLALTDDEDEAYQMMEDMARTPLHYWVQINDLIVDITADQFNDELDSPMPTVVIGNVANMGRYQVTNDNFIEPKEIF